MKISEIFVVGLICVFSLSDAWSATYTAASCNVANVQTAVNSASDGDTVIIPNGSCTWTSGILTSKQIRISGATVPTRTNTATDGTTIVHAAGRNTLFVFTIGNSFNSTIANLRFQATTGTGSYVKMLGTGKPPLMHDIYMNEPASSLAFTTEWYVAGGVIWNCTFESTTNNGACSHGNTAGDNIKLTSTVNWDNASTMGTNDTNGQTNTYIEDCIFINLPTIDVDENARVVLRHCNLRSPTTGGSHGPTSTYGGRHVEIYDNTFSLPDKDVDVIRYYWMRGGTGVFTGNSFQAITLGSCHGGTRATLQFIVENTTRTTSHNCCTAWECFHQPGSGSNGTSRHDYLSANQTPYDSYQIPEPVYIWGNSGTGNTVALLTSTNNQTDDCGKGYVTTDFFVQNQDYFVSTDSSAAKPGWTRYTYPHPLRQSKPPLTGPLQVPHKTYRFNLKNCGEWRMNSHTLKERIYIGLARINV